MAKVTGDLNNKSEDDDDDGGGGRAGGAEEGPYPGQAVILLLLGVLEPLHELGVAQQVPVQRAVFGQGQVRGVLGQRGALVMALRESRGGRVSTGLCVFRHTDRHTDRPTHRQTDRPNIHNDT